MKFRAQNDIKARVRSIQSDPVMTLVKCELIVKAVHVLPVKR